MPLSVSDRVAAVIVTCNRPELLARSLTVVAAQSKTPDWIIVIDNDDDDDVASVMERSCGVSPVADVSSGSVVHVRSKTNLGGAGGFALGFLMALAAGADAIWCADDDGTPEDEHVLETLLTCAQTHGLDEVSPVVVNQDDPATLAFPLRRGLSWRRRREELIKPENPGDDVLLSMASLFNGAVISRAATEIIGVPDYRLFIRGDEVEYHRRLARSGLRFGTCLTTAYLHPDGSDEFKPILGGRMHTQYPDNDTKRFFTYRNRGYLMNQPGMRKLLPQEYARFAWFFLIQRKDPRGFATWLRLHQMGRGENFQRPNSGRRDNKKR